MKLISMTDFVLGQWEKSNEHPQEYIEDSNYLRQILSYANFLNQPLTLSMFVPTTSDRDLIEEPEHFKQWSISENLPQYSELTNSKCKEYQEAKERCLFSEIEYVEAKLKTHSDIVRISKSLNTINYPKFWKDFTVEDLIPYDLELTPTAQEQLSL